MTVSHKQAPLQFNYSLSGSPLTRVTEYKYLGVTFDFKYELDEAH